MKTLSEQLSKQLPFKNIAAALLFSVFLGPVGVLYSSVTGGIVMMVLGFIVLCAKFIVPIILVWMISCAWSVAAANQYNEKLINKLTAIQ